ncbi:MAG: biopolymer transporter ExbD [Phycisphaerales bacterium]|nr:biopolymer transporter ExbD [Phycisphaerales bacterium]
MNAIAHGNGSTARPLRRRDAAAVRDATVGANMTPMVDVVLVILIFFMASTAFIGPEWFLRAALPSDQAADQGGADFSLPPARFEIVLAIGADGRPVATGLGLDGASVDAMAARIGEYAARLGPDRLTIVIKPDAPVAYSDVIRVHEACAAAGIESVALD